jgi:hypothetical protein
VNRRWFFIFPVIGLLAGCARVSTSTGIRPDGSFSRKVVYTVSKSEGLSAPGSEGEKIEPGTYFKLPSSAGDVKVARTEDKNNLVVTVTRDVPTGGSPLQDITLWAKKGKVMATSTVSVTKLSDGRIEYVETLHAVEPSAKSQKFMSTDLRAQIKKALPADAQKTELIDKLTQNIMTNLAHALLGPPEPYLLNLAMNPDATARRINGIAFATNVQAFKEALPAISEAEASAMARTLVNLLNTEAVEQNKSAESGPSSGPDNELTPLTFAVSFPGKIVETNGLVDPMTGEVYWSLLPMTLEVGDVKLRLVVQP